MTIDVSSCDSNQFTEKSLQSSLDLRKFLLFLWATFFYLRGNREIHMISNGSLRNKGTSTCFADGNLLFYFTLRNLSILAISLRSHVSLHTVTFLFTHIHLPSTQPCTSIHSYVYFHSYILHIVSIFSPHSYLLSHFFTQPHPSLHSYILHTPICLFFYTSYIHISLLYSYIFKLSTHSDIYIYI